MPTLCFSFPSRWSRLRSKPAKQFTVSYRRANSVDPYDQVNIRPVAPPRPLSTLMPTQIDGYTLPHTPHPSHLIHPTSSLNRLRSEIENEVNPAIKYFTLSRETPNGQEEFPTAPRIPTTPASEEDEFYNTPMEHAKPSPGLNDWRQQRRTPVNDDRVFCKTWNKEKFIFVFHFDKIAKFFPLIEINVQSFWWCGFHHW